VTVPLYMLVVGNITIDRRKRTFGTAKIVGDAALCVSNDGLHGL
jgi:hypothetical protein